MSTAFSPFLGVKWTAGCWLAVTPTEAIRAQVPRKFSGSTAAYLISGSRTHHQKPHEILSPSPTPSLGGGHPGYVLNVGLESSPARPRATEGVPLLSSSSCVPSTVQVEKVPDADWGFSWGSLHCNTERRRRETAARAEHEPHNSSPHALWLHRRGPAMNI